MGSGQNSNAQRFIEALIASETHYGSSSMFLRNRIVFFHYNFFFHMHNLTHINLILSMVYEQFSLSFKMVWMRTLTWQKGS